MTDTAIGYEWKGLEALQPHLIPADSVQPHPRNVRKGNVDALARMLQRYGQMSPIVVQRSTGNICKGNHTWKAAQKLGWTHIAATMADLDDDTAYQYLLADNRASDLAEYDKAALARSLQELADAGKLQGTLWTADDVDDIQAAVGTLETLAVEFKGDYSDDPKQREERLQRELTRIAPKMREVPIVVTVDQHRIFMENINLLKKEWHTDGAIETILLAVQKAADGYREEVKPIDSPEPESMAAATTSRNDGPQPPENPQVAPVPTQPFVSPLRAPTPVTGGAEQAPAARFAAEFRQLLSDWPTDKEMGRATVLGYIEKVQPFLGPGEHPASVVALRKACVDFRQKIMSQTGKAAFTMSELWELLDA